MMIDVDDILIRVQETDMVAVLEELLQTTCESYFAASLEDYGCRILDNSNLNDKDYLLLAVCGDEAQMEMQAAAQLAILPCLFVNWQAQLVQHNYYKLNPGKIKGLPCENLNNTIESRNYFSDTASLGNYASNLDCPVYEVLDIRNGVIRFSEFSNIEPYEYPLFCILPADNKGELMQTAANTARASEALNKMNQHNLRLLYMTVGAQY